MFAETMTDEALDATAPGSDPRRADEPAGVELGGSLDRYRLVRRLGEGGMGIVYEAFDAELDRRVALKVLRHPVRGQSPEANARRARLVREAQAMARVSHANVVPVFDAGTAGEDLFVAMELVDGEDLARWLAARRRDWRETVDVFIQAGRGLAAAHRAGLIHRDFKPSNVIVGRDGRVRVLDFGLARAAEAAPEAVASRVRRDRPVLESPLTVEGDLLGTPMYMSPEQYSSAVLDARSDQFSFCASLFEALTGKTPFEGKSLDDVATAVAKGRVRQWPAGVRLPRRLRRTVMRGLAVDPQERFASLDEVTSALSSIRSFRRRAVTGAAVAGLVGATATLAFALGSQREEAPCSGAEQQLTGVWDEATQAAIDAAFGKSQWTGAPAALADVKRRLSTYSDGWVTMRTEACEATRRGEQSAELLDLRVACLDQRRGEVGALARLLGRADETVVIKAVSAAFELTPLELCADAAALRQATPPPRDPAVRARVAGVRHRLETAAALLRATKYAEGLDLARPLSVEAAAIGYAPLRAEAFELLAELEDLGGQAPVAESLYRRAAVAASEAGNDHLLATAWVKLIYVIGYLEARPEEALQVSEFAASLLPRARVPALRGKLHNNRGTVHYMAGQLDDAAREFQAAIAEREKLYGNDHPDVATSMANLGAVRNSQGQLDEAEKLQRRALELRKRLLGEQHPDVAMSLSNIGAVLQARGDLEGAIGLEKEALAIRRTVLGPRHSETAASLTNLGGYFGERDRWDEAVGPLTEAVAAYRATLTGDHPYLGSALSSLTEALVNAGRSRGAIPLGEEALKIFSGADADKTSQAHARCALGMALIDTRQDVARGRGLVEQARVVYVELENQGWIAATDKWLKRAR